MKQDEEKIRPNCYECEFRRSVPGDAHSQCVHPNTRKGGQELNIKGNAHGVKMGWFYWPLNFDPTWLDNCDGFTKKEAP